MDNFQQSNQQSALAEVQQSAAANITPQPDPNTKGATPGDPVKPPVRYPNFNRIIILTLLLGVCFIVAIISLMVNSFTGNKNNVIPPAATQSSPTPGSIITPTLTPAPITQTPSAVPTAIIKPTLALDSSYYVSRSLGIAFNYPKNTDYSVFYIKESGEKICVTTNQTDSNCNYGQSIQVFNKENKLSLEQAITKQFLEGKSAQECWVEPYQALDYPPEFKAAEIAFKMDQNVNAETIETTTSNCAKGYARTNGVRYFLGDTNHPDKYLFINIGQMSFMTTKGKTWEKTIIFLD